jgi:murein DD-endopeptidase MepM/ murein hydrolase activator NlpD
MRLQLLLLLAALPAALLPAHARGGSLLVPTARLGHISSGFGPRADGFHPGLDLAAPYGSPVRAATAGVVVSAGWAGEYGKMIELRSRNGMVTRYAHLSVINAKVRVGRRIAAGQTIGAVGMTGYTTGPHLHFEVRIAGRIADPATLLFARPKATPARPKHAHLRKTKSARR